MAINKQSNLYTVIYIVVMVLVVGVSLAGVSLALAPKQKANADADKMKQILAAVHITPEAGQIITEFDKIVTSQAVYNSQGQQTGDDAFGVDVKQQIDLPDDRRQLPVYTCRMPDGSTKYVLPVYGAGLWGPIWGYVAVDADGSTIYGAYFAHQGETPGLGAEIEKPHFSDQFDGKQLIKHGEFLPVEVVKNGMKPQGEADYVDGVSGGTITSRGVSDMLANCLTPYRTFLKNLTK